MTVYVYCWNVQVNSIDEDKQALQHAMIFREIVWATKKRICPEFQNID